MDKFTFTGARPEGSWHETTAPDEALGLQCALVSATVSHQTLVLLGVLVRDWLIPISNQENEKVLGVPVAGKMVSVQA